MYAMENHRERLADDHRNAREFASGISDVDGINIDVDSVETNIVRYDISSPATEVADRLLEAGVWVLATGPNTIRAVFNLMVSNDDVAKAIEVVRSVSVSS
jgi:threonine aldolase